MMAVGDACLNILFLVLAVFPLLWWSIINW